MIVQVCTRNAVRCKKCEAIIDSVRGHDFVTCPCKSVSIDGGIGRNASIRTLWPSGSMDDWVEDLREYVQDEVRSSTARGEVE